MGRFTRVLLAVLLLLRTVYGCRDLVAWNLVAVFVNFLSVGVYLPSFEEEKLKASE